METDRKATILETTAGSVSDWKEWVSVTSRLPNSTGRYDVMCSRLPGGNSQTKIMFHVEPIHPWSYERGNELMGPMHWEIPYHNLVTHWLDNEH